MSKYKGKKVLVVGFGLSGVSVARYMVRQGAKVTVTDTKTKAELADSVKACEDLKIEYDLGQHNPETFKSVEMIILSPGVNPSSIKFLDEIKALPIQFTNEVDLASAALKEPLIGVTGTNGKTTTTTLIGEMFKADRRSAYVGGNIGTPLLDYFTDGVRESTKSEVMVAELSSFQLELVQKMVPAVAVFTNIQPDHLDRYPNMEAYIEAKKKLLKVCDKNTYVVLNYDDPIVQSFAHESAGRIIWFTKKDPLKMGGSFAEQFVGCYYSAQTKTIHARITGKEEIFDVSKIKIYGEHNKENLMAAICAARVMGVSPQAIQNVIENFRGVPHRIEFVRRKDGVYFFNDSKATNPVSMMKALSSFPANPIILIAGGKDKNFDFSPCADLVRERCKLLILMGEAKEKMNRSIGDFVETYLVGTFEEAILLGFQKSRSGDIILLSPGCSSYDMFKNYEERGDYYKKLVNQL